MIFRIYADAIRNYVNFSGRMRRRDYWVFSLTAIAMVVVSIAIDAAISEPADPNLTIAGILVLFHFLPALAAGVRRLHDQGKSGFWWLIRLVPLIGGLWLLVLMLTAGDNGPNRYGPDPRQSQPSLGSEDVLDDARI